MPMRVLVVDDDEPTCEMLVAALTGGGHEAVDVGSAEKAWERLQADDLDVVITDVSLGGMDGLELCRRMHASMPDIPVIVLTGHGNVDTAVAALRAGAHDFLPKPIVTELLLAAVARAGTVRQLGREARRLRRELADVRAGTKLIGKSPAMLEVLDLIARVAESDANVLVVGESGTGKELVARSIHDRSRRHDGPFVAINCAAVPSTLIESELFGHVRGAFTDAKTARDGLFVQAEGGTLFLDEIGELPLDMQPKLLRALQERRVRPIGAESEVPFDTRIVAATNRDLEAMASLGTFREDLLYRLDVVRVDVPPLRRRREDVVMLAEHILEKLQSRAGEKRVNGIHPAAAEKLREYDWPGNVRELENVIERALALARGDELRIEDIPAKVRDFQPQRVIIAPDALEEFLPLEEFQRRYIMGAIELVAGNKTRAARVLGLDRRTLYRRLDTLREPSPSKIPASSTRRPRHP